MRFFEQVPRKASITFDERGLRSEMDEPDDEAVRAAITQFRQIYDHDEPNSFHKAMNLLKRSAHEHDGAQRDEVIALLDGHLDAGQVAMGAGVGIGIVFEHPEGQQQMDSRRIINAYFHGHYLHSGNPKTELARRLDDLQPLPRYTLYNVMLLLRNVYSNAANAVDRVLEAPEILDTDPLPRSVQLPLAPSPPGTAFEATASCQPGEKVLSGGVNTPNGEPFSVADSQKMGEGWRARVVASTGVPPPGDTLTVDAYCLVP
jgi:hypothetical protein